MKTAIEQKLSKKIRALRKEYNFTQERLAELAEIDYKHIQLLESPNPPSIRLNTLEKIAKAFNMTPSKLIDF
ncbi:MAG TPA: helix-turn-helix transcriptional regulator [Candidatus Omnitrophota bacterium]|nr:helix-turn-helix transcriptional regulator [Candidatus Omnitrophota bacterium]HPN88236.1 helix-turn-helix transcriptional regulator [Candidatus Omnitrophota bacterium]